MDWISFTTGMLAATFAHALFSYREEDELELEEELAITDHTARHVVLSCQTCRKLKKHREVEPDLYQCTKCKRHVDLRSA